MVLGADLRTGAEGRLHCMGLSGSRSAACYMQHAIYSIILLQSEANASEVLPRMGVTLAACRMPHASQLASPSVAALQARQQRRCLTYTISAALSRRFSALLRCCSALSFAPPSCQLIKKLATETFTKHLAKNAHLPETCADCVMRRRDGAAGRHSRRSWSHTTSSGTSPCLCPR